MFLKRFELVGMRNLDTVRLELDARVNVLEGPNGSGKTSFLEGIHLLGRGCSFRSRRSEDFIAHDQDEVRAFGLVVEPDGSQTRLGVGRCRGGGSELRLNGAKVDSGGELARVLPLVMLTPESLKLVWGGPGERRRFLDWGVFHVEHASLWLWQRYSRGLKQRNSALRAGVAPHRVQAWDEDLASAGTLLDSLRRSYLERVGERIRHYAKVLGLGKEVELHYAPGWGGHQSLLSALHSSLCRDSRAGATQVGPHRADLLLSCEGTKAQPMLSRGEQKVVVAAMLLAQAACLKGARGEAPVVLLDDLAAELDLTHRGVLLDAMRSLGSQMFVTGTVLSEALPARDYTASVFHVEQGVVQAMV